MPVPASSTLCPGVKSAAWSIAATTAGIEEDDVGVIAPPGRPSST